MPDPTTAVLGGAAGIGSSIANIFGAQSAAQAYQQAAQQANSTILQQQQNGLNAQNSYFNTGNGPLAGIANQGNTAYANLNAAIPGLTAPIVMNQAQLEQTPGYQFNLSQGERGVQLGGAALGLSGAQVKSAAQYATGLASNTYQQQFNNANTNKQNAYNFLLGTAQTGVGAAGQYGQNATYAGAADVANSAQVGGQLSNNLINAGQAQGAANVATGQQVGNAFGAASKLFPSTTNTNPFGMYSGTNNPTTPGSLY